MFSLAVGFLFWKKSDILEGKFLKREILWVVLCFVFWGAGVVEASPRFSRSVVISGVYFDGYLRGDPEPEESIRLTNVSERSVDISGWKISDRYFYAKGLFLKGRRRRHRSRFTEMRTTNFDQKANGRDIVLPSGTILKPHQSIWIAYQGRAFRKVFGRYPAIEGISTVGNLPQASLPRGWPHFYASRGVVSLHDANDETVDLVCYVRDSRQDNLDKRLIPNDHWSGPAVVLKGANIYSWTGQILARDRDPRGRPIPDTNTAHDWDNSFSKTQLGVDLTHRMERPGQSHYTFQRHRSVRATVLVTSSPENNYRALIRAFRRARREILINIYQFTNDFIADALVKARRRGVHVEILMDGSPVGGVRRSSRYIAQRLAKAGAIVYWMRSLRRPKTPRRYRFNHAKYVIIDRRLVIIGTENYGSTGHSLLPSYGNRGWEVHVRSPQIVAELLKVFRDDTNRQRYRDLVLHRQDLITRWGAPPRNYRIKRKVKRGYYAYRKSPLLVSGRMDLQLVLSPDNSLNETNSIIGSILSCRREVLALQNSIPLSWGKKHFRSFSTTPDLPLHALIKAARQGCRVRVLLDSTWYHIQNSKHRDNDDTVRKLNEIARKEGLDLQAKLINLTALGLSKIHAKGIIVDRRETFIGSINWTENSFKGNREVGIIIRHPKVARYYVDLFMYDWLHSKLFTVIISTRKAPVYQKPNVLSRVVGMFAAGDPLDVLAEIGEFYQVRLGHRSIGYLLRANHQKLMSDYEALFQVGRVAVIYGKIRRIRYRRKLIVMYFQAPFKRALTIILWRSSYRRYKRAFDDILSKIMRYPIQIKGKITTYRNNPQVVLRVPEQLTILD